MTNYLLTLDLGSISNLNTIGSVLLFISVFWGFVWLVIGITDYQASFKGLGKILFIASVALLPMFMLTNIDKKIEEVRKYSYTQLKDLVLDIDGDLYSIIPERVEPVGNLTLKISGSRKKLGRINCDKLSYTACVEKIKNNKADIVSKIKSEINFAIIDL